MADKSIVVRVKYWWYEGNNKLEFYGVIKDIIELSYGINKDVLPFKCDLWDVGNKKTGIHSDAHFTSINASRTCTMFQLWLW